MTKTIAWPLAPAPAAPTERARRWAALALHRAGTTLTRWARGLHRQEPIAPAAEPVLEFYAEAGAPEGALYLDGQLVGTLEGVTRL
jgi:hypothetical protein